MKLDKFRAQAAGLLEAGETVEAVAKVTPRGVAEEFIIRGAAGAGAGAVSPTLWAAGAAAADGMASSAGDEGRDERAEAGIDLGNAQQVIFAVTGQRLVFFKRSALGKPKEILASLPRNEVAAAVMGETKLFGQTMPEIQLTNAAGAEVGFGVAKIDRKDGEAIVAALNA